MTCCDLHGRNWGLHRMSDATRGFHADGSTCSNPDLSRCNRHIAAELLAWAAMLDAAEGLYAVRAMHQNLAADLRSRAFWLSPPNPDDHTEIQARLKELRGNR